ncbi:MAG TPA: phosphotransferase [Dehalococcoidia bacterium]|nr:phosphotransferase [Dehalococcoidia bacterium]
MIDLITSVPRVLGAWGLRADEVRGVPGGTLNHNFDVTAGGRRFFLRCYRANLETERIFGEHELVRWAAARGIATPVPVEAKDGGSVFIDGAERWALFPWVDGEPGERGALSPARVASLGDAHGRLQATLATHPASAGARMRRRWDKADSLRLLDDLLRICDDRPDDADVRETVARQRELLEEWDVRPPEDFAALPCQMLHGDFHDQQVLFRGDAVAGIVDWEIWHEDARAWELVRSLSFSRLLDSPLLEVYLGAYRRHVQLAEGEVQFALTLWFQSRVVGLWVWWAYLVEGNERLRPFFAETRAELERVSDPRWTSAVRERFVRAAT